MYPLIQWFSTFLTSRHTKIKKKKTFGNIQWISVIANSVVNKHSVITNRILIQISHFSTEINPVMTNTGYNEQKWPVPRYSF